MAVGDGQPISVTLHEDSRMIDEVVVVGYGVQKKANLTGAVSSVKMDEVLGNRRVGEQRFDGRHAGFAGDRYLWTTRFGTLF